MIDFDVILNIIFKKLNISINKYDIQTQINVYDDIINEYTVICTCIAKNNNVFTQKITIICDNYTLENDFNVIALFDNNRDIYEFIFDNECKLIEHYKR